MYSSYFTAADSCERTAALSCLRREGALHERKRVVHEHRNRPENAGTLQESLPRPLRVMRGGMEKEMLQCVCGMVAKSCRTIWIHATCLRP